MIFFFEKIPSIFDIENWLWKYDFGTFWQTGAPRILKIQRFPLSIAWSWQKACILGPTIFKIPQPNWHYGTCQKSPVTPGQPHCGHHAALVNRMCQQASTWHSMLFQNTFVLQDNQKKLKSFEKLPLYSLCGCFSWTR